ncbi:unnamed protein product, partial [Brenthis ino]
MPASLERNADTSTAKGLLKEKNDNDNDTWKSWTPKNLNTPVSSKLKVTRKNEEDCLKRRRPKIDCSSDELNAVFFPDVIFLPMVLASLDQVVKGI